MSDVNVTQAPDELTAQLAVMTGPQLVEFYNHHVEVWIARGGDNTFGVVRRFATAEVGRARVERIHAAIQERFPQPDPKSVAAAKEAAPEAGGATEESDDMAKRKAGRKPVRKATGARRNTEGPTLATYLAEYNDLVPAAKKAGIKWAKVHTSNFESKDKAKAQIARLKEAIRKAK